MVEEKIEAPKRIWVPQSALMNGGGSIYIGQAWDDNDTEYARVDRAPNTRQRAERAAQRMMEMFARQGRRYLNDRLRQQLADIIAAESEK